MISTRPNGARRPRAQTLISAGRPPLGIDRKGGALAALLAAVVTGCGGDSSTPTTSAPSTPPALQQLAQASPDAADPSAVPPAAPAQPATQSAPASQTRETEVQPAQTPAPASAQTRLGGRGLGGSRGSTATESAPAENARPDDLAAWKPDDFRAAREANDPRLVEAVEHLGTTKKGDEATANLLVALLAPTEEKAPEQSNSGRSLGGRRPSLGGRGLGRNLASQSRGGGAGLTATVIGALAQNASPPALQAIEAILSGKLETDGTAADASLAALSALATNAGEVDSYQDLLLRAATAPGDFATAEGDDPESESLSTDELQGEALRMLQSTATAETRVRMAQVEDGAQGAVTDLLMEPLVENLDAQVMLYLSDGTDAQIKADIGEMFAGYSVAAIDQLLGVPAGAGGTSSPRRGIGGGLAARTPRPTRANTGQQRGLADRARTPAPQQRPRSGGLASNLNRPNRAADRGTPRRGGRGLASNLNRPNRAGAARSSRSGAAAALPSVEPLPSVDEALASDPQASIEVIRRVWDPRLIDIVAFDAGQVASLEEGRDVLQYALSVPASPTRLAIVELIREHWQEGPDAFRSGATFGSEIRDPGLMFAIKAAPRRADPAKRQTRSSRNTTRRPAGRLGSRAGGQSRGGRELSAEDLAKIEWMSATEEFIRELNGRFYSAAQNGGGVAGAERRRGSSGIIRRVAWQDEATSANADAEATGSQKTAEGQNVPPGGLGFPLHKDASVTAEYHVDWPADLAALPEGIDLLPLRVHYVRIEEENHPGRVESFYSRHLKDARKRTLDDGTWLDFVERGPEPGWRRSVDVLIETEGGGAAGGGLGARAPTLGRNARGARGGDRGTRARTESEELVVEILSIEIFDPTQSAQAAEAGP